MSETETSPPQAPPLTGDALGFLMKEYDVLRDLYGGAEASAQSIFNFYLTLISTAFGAVVLIIQFPRQSPGSEQRTLLLVSAMLVFGAAVGSVLLSSLVGRYAHMARYAAGADNLRRYLIEQLKVPVPASYEPLLAKPATPRRITTWTSVLFPVGSYQFFMAGMNGLSLGIATLLIFLAAEVRGELITRAVTGAVVVSLLTFTIYNIYSHLLVRRLVKHLAIRIDTGQALPFIAGKQ